MNWKGFLARLAASLVLVFTTFNPWGASYYHWAIAPIVKDVGSFSAVKFLAGVILVVGWVVALQATRRSIGWKGALLVAALCGGIIWLLAEQHWLNATNARVMEYVVLIVVSLILGVGMSWSHVSRRLTGQTDTDIVSP
jgi:hypothetical protein